MQWEEYKSLHVNFNERVGGPEVFWCLKGKFAKKRDRKTGKNSGRVNL